MEPPKLREAGPAGGQAHAFRDLSLCQFGLSTQLLQVGAGEAADGTRPATACANFGPRTPGNKPADPRTRLEGRALDHAILEIDAMFPGHVTVSGSPRFVADVLASLPDGAQGRRFAIDPARWPVERARASAEIKARGLFPSQERLARRLGIGVRTVRAYDKAARGRSPRRASPCRSATGRT